MLGHAWSLVQEAVRSGRIPGAALGAVTTWGEPQLRLAGWAQLEPAQRPLQPEQLFDLASLTKVLFTLPQILEQVERGALDLDHPLGRYLPELQENSAWLASCSIRSLLTHQAGLPADAPLHRWDQLSEEAILSHPWERGPEVYSDIGYILLGIVLERVSGVRLDRLPLPPGFSFHPDPDQAVATERCSWRGRVMVGEVHDEKAYALGGPAGHAGLFGGASSVLRLAASYLRGDALSPAALAELRRPHSAERALGWQRKHPGWSGGSLCSPGCLGHTGFTGTALWIDFERGLAWTLLTNRVHPSRQAETGIIPLRVAVSNAISTSWRPT